LHALLSQNAPRQCSYQTIVSHRTARANVRVASQVITTSVFASKAAFISHGRP
jgi:hypothetical protein